MIKTKRATSKYDGTLEELKFERSKELKAKCKEVIESGFKSNIKDGVTEEHYNLRLEDQTNMTILMEDIKNGATKVPWHNSSQTICEVWEASKFIELYKQSKEYIVSQRFYCDGLEEMISRAVGEAEVESVEWGVALPDDIQTQIAGVMSQLGGA